MHGSSITSPAFVTLLHAALRTIIDELGCVTFNVGILNICVDENPETAPSSDQAKPRQVVARVVSRGKMSSAASDYGCLEVFGGASIGHTDPYVGLKALDSQLNALAVNGGG